jgi:cytochrome c551/c552
MSSSDQGHKILTSAMIGRNTMAALDCRNCHQTDQKSIGPSFIAVSEKYKNDPQAANYLVNKIINGGGGVWGEVPMAAHPDLKKEDAANIVTWIQSLSSEESKVRYPSSGTLPPILGQKEKENGVLVIAAAFTDEGAPGIKPMTGTGEATLRNSKMFLDNASDLSGFTSMNYNGKRILLVPRQKGAFAAGTIDMTGISAVSVGAGWQKPPLIGYSIEFRLDSPEGTLLGKGTIKGDPASKPGMNASVTTIPIQKVNDGKYHQIYIVTAPISQDETTPVGIQFLKFIAK